VTRDDLIRAIAYNRWQRANGRLTDEDEAIAYAHFQTSHGLTVDGMAGERTLAAMRSQEVTVTAPEVSPFGSWVYPMPDMRLNGVSIPAAVSSGFGKDGRGNKDRPNHWGVDIMYRRHGVDGGPQERYPDGHRFAGLRRAKSPVYSHAWYCPRGIPIYAVGPGTVWSVNWGANNNVKIDHHNVAGFGPLATWYQHCYDIFVRPGDEVAAGDTIGIVGEGSSDLIHLHFEWRDHNRGSGRRAVVVDPAPFLRPLKKLQIERIEP
jgi:murein DD-endopeptidase MepM/ murein hydrolase activator NlpD